MSVCIRALYVAFCIPLRILKSLIRAGILLIFSEHFPYVQTMKSWLGVGAFLAFAALASATAWPAKFIEMPLIRQGRDYTCGVAATASVVNFWTGDEWLEDDLCFKLKCNDQDGTRYREIVTWAQKQDYNAQVRQNMTLTDVFKIIDAGTPLIVLIQVPTRALACNQHCSFAGLARSLSRRLVQAVG